MSRQVVEVDSDAVLKEIESRKERSTSAKTAAAAAGVGTILAPVAAFAQGDGAVTQATTMVTSLGGIATAATGVIIGAMTVRYAIKFVNRLMVKG